MLLIESIYLFAQTPQESINRIDSMIFRDTKRLRSEAKYEALIPLSQKIIQESKSLDYTRGEAWGYARLGNVYCTLGNYKESLKSLNIAKQLSQSIDDPSLKTSITIETGRNYNESKISLNQAIEQFEKAIGFAKEISDTYERESYILFAYQNLASVYSYQNKNDKSLAYIWKAKAIEEDAYTLSHLTYLYLHENKNKDSILYYLDRSKAFFEKNPKYVFEKTILHNQWGKYNEANKSYKQAIDYYLKAEKYGKESKANEELLKSYNGLSRCYEVLGNYEESIKYERRFSRLQGNMMTSKDAQVDNSVNQIVKAKDEVHKSEVSLMQKIVIALFIVAVGIGTIFLINFFRVKEQRKKTEDLLTEKEIIIQEKEEEAQELKLKLNESIEEIIHLAKENSPEFWGRFQEVYPEFRNRLLSINSDLKPSELTLAAYIYLGFNAKDIAEYTFKAVKTIKNNKYNLRKRLEIPTKDDFTIWMRNFADS